MHNTSTDNNIALHLTTLEMPLKEGRSNVICHYLCCSFGGRVLPEQENLRSLLWERLNTETDLSGFRKLSAYNSAGKLIKPRRGISFLFYTNGTDAGLGTNTQYHLVLLIKASPNCWRNAAPLCALVRNISTYTKRSARWKTQC